MVLGPIPCLNVFWVWPTPAIKSGLTQDGDRFWLGAFTNLHGCRCGLCLVKWETIPYSHTKSSPVISISKCLYGCGLFWGLQFWLFHDLEDEQFQVFNSNSRLNKFVIVNISTIMSIVKQCLLHITLFLFFYL